eukprot:CAMPEP_0204295180 /NCGR_PEP_ID=MMETSP0468-20130131/69219_1 /ASSEMBLY_ACC=CAM_ASM_000383 /TAXON_ID=2969 /ORGANISM="Oxyrrhis marina" /LENGTH=45 /DNA_ID= /DNA_START= /DNA_END= /DNA_ORIENTATION=
MDDTPNSSTTTTNPSTADPTSPGTAPPAWSAGGSSRFATATTASR